jgi:exopolyphosphatase/guanosine-5'-triphosphate,3'-diphosphate pyrophosphatase
MKSNTKKQNIQIAAIDIGTNSIRMAIAQAQPNGKIEILEQLHQAVHLGQDTFRSGYIERRSMRSAVAILRNYRKVIDTYRIKHVLAVATTSVREAVNSDAFIDRIAMATGIDVEVIDAAEEGRLTVAAVKEAMGKSLNIGHRNTIIAEVGGGSTLLTVLQRGKIIQSLSLPIGSVRLNEIFIDSSRTPEDAAELLDKHIAGATNGIGSMLPVKKISVFIALGSDARFAARTAGKKIDGSEFYMLGIEDFNKVVDICRQWDPQQISNKYGLAFSDAETLCPALLSYKHLIEAAGVNEIVVSPVSMREGLLVELLGRITGKEDRDMYEAVINSAKVIAHKYQIDMQHCLKVCEYCEKIFDDLASLHTMGKRDRLLLRVAAIIHEIGMFVSARAHHKHSYYLISNTEIFGLNHTEVQIVAHVSRYHRKNSPKPNHTEYINMPRKMRTTICRLAALLRISDALDCERSQQIDLLKTEIDDDELVLYVAGIKGLALEKRSLAQKSDLFEDIFGLRVRLQEVNA